MEIVPSSIVPVPTVSQNAPRQPQGQSLLSVGQQLVATVASVDADGNITLNIDSLILAAKTELKLSPGQLLDLIVTQKGGQVVLRLSDPATKEAVIGQALREGLPRQQPLTEIVANLAFLAKQPAVAGGTLPAVITQMAQQIMRQLPSSKDVSQADTLKASLREAGVFLEHKLKDAVLSNSAPEIARDLKAALLQLRSALQALERPATGGGGRESRAAASATTPPAPGQGAAPESVKSGQGSTTTAPGAVGETKQAGLEVAKPAQPLPGGSEAATARLVKALATPAPLFQPVDAESEMPPPGPRTDARSPADRAHAQLKGAGDSALPGTKVQAQSSAAATLENPPLDLDPMAELLKQVEGALARTQLHQLATLAEQDHGRMLLAFELPVRHQDRTDVIQMHIEREARRGEGETEPPTTVTLGFDIEPLGPMYARVTLLKDIVSVMLWAERPETAQLFGSHLADLRERLERNGLKAEHLAAHVGSPPQSFVRLDSRSLLDVQA